MPKPASNVFSMCDKLIKPISLAIFDMAGTTIQENNLVYRTMHEVLVKHDLGVDLETVLSRAAGKEKRTALADLLAGADPAYVDSLFLEFKQALDLNYAKAPIDPIDGTDRLFRFLRESGISVVLNTGYDRRTAEVLIQRVGWKVGEDIDGLIVADDVQRGRPFPDMIEEAMMRFGISDPGVTLKAGDSVVDIEEGKQANCGVTVGVLTGAQTREQLVLAEPDYILDSLVDLIPILQAEDSV